MPYSDDRQNILGMYRSRFIRCGISSVSSLCVVVNENSESLGYRYDLLQGIRDS